MREEKRVIQRDRMESDPDPGNGLKVILMIGLAAVLAVALFFILTDSKTADIVDEVTMEQPESSEDAVEGPQTSLDNDNTDDTVGGSVDTGVDEEEPAQ